LYVINSLSGPYIGRALDKCEQIGEQELNFSKDQEGAFGRVIYCMFFRGSLGFLICKMQFYREKKIVRREMGMGGTRIASSGDRDVKSASPRGITL
jgi:hypothetical protein